MEGSCRRANPQVFFQVFIPSLNVITKSCRDLAASLCATGIFILYEPQADSVRRYQWYCCLLKALQGR